MKQFEIPSFYRSPIISKVKAIRKSLDPRKKDFTPTRLDFGNFELLIARHFGFCYGVENAIEIAYRAIDENPGKRIFLLSQMIHNPGVNEDLAKHGITFIQDTSGKQLISWDEITNNDVVIIPAFGTTIEIENILKEKGVNIEAYDTTCPFVEKVWNRSEKLGKDDHTLIIHGKFNHEETRATFSHTAAHTHAVIVKDVDEAHVLGEFIGGKRNMDEFYAYFKGRYTKGFDPGIHFEKIGVINQTTMLASETQEIADYLKSVVDDMNLHKNKNRSIADTRDTLCYATNDNQSATFGLMESKPNLAFVVGGYNSSNTTHLVELLEKTCTTFFVKDTSEFNEDGSFYHFDIHLNERKLIDKLPEISSDFNKIAITSGASCPDSTVDEVINLILTRFDAQKTIEEVLKTQLNVSTE